MTNLQCVIIRWTVIIIASCITTIGNSQQKKIEKISLGTGIGVNYSYLGLKFNYEVLDHLDVFASLGFNQILLGTPVIGLEYIANKNELKKIKPFVNMSFGKDYSVINRISSQNSNLQEGSMRISRQFGTGNLSTGLLVNPSKVNNKIALKFGLTARYFNKQNVDQYLSDINTTYATNFSSRERNLFLVPVIALRLNVKEIFN